MWGKKISNSTHLTDFNKPIDENSTHPWLEVGVLLARQDLGVSKVHPRLLLGHDIPQVSLLGKLEGGEGDWRGRPRRLFFGHLGVDVLTKPVPKNSPCFYSCVSTKVCTTVTISFLFFLHKIRKCVIW